VKFDPSIPALRCELLPESTTEETLFVSISPFSGLYKVTSYMGKKLTSMLFDEDFSRVFRKSIYPTDRTRT